MKHEEHHEPRRTGRASAPVAAFEAGRGREKEKKALGVGASP